MPTKAPANVEKPTDLDRAARAITRRAHVLGQPIGRREARSALSKKLRTELSVDEATDRAIALGWLQPTCGGWRALQRP